MKSRQEVNTSLTISSVSFDIAARSKQCWVTYQNPHSQEIARMHAGKKNKKTAAFCDLKAYASRTSQLKNMHVHVQEKKNMHVHVACGGVHVHACACGGEEKGEDLTLATGIRTSDI